MMTLEEAIKAEEAETLAYEECLNSLDDNMPTDMWNELNKSLGKQMDYHRQLAEWLKKLQKYESFADWLVEAILEEDWEDDSDFYTEVLCRKLTKLGKLKVVDNKYMVVNADEKDN